MSTIVANNENEVPTVEPPLDRLVVAILPDVDADQLLVRLAAYGFGATRIASSGGYLRASNSTLLIGLPATKLEICLAVLRSLCSPVDGIGYPAPEQTELYASGYASTPAGAGVVFVANVIGFERVSGAPD